MASRSQKRSVGSQVRSASQGTSKGKKKSLMSRVRTRLSDGLTGRKHSNPNLGFPSPRKNPLKGKVTKARSAPKYRG
jgi:hypothetical protein